MRKKELAGNLVKRAFEKERETYDAAESITVKSRFDKIVDVGRWAGRTLTVEVIGEKGTQETAGFQNYPGFPLAQGYYLQGGSNAEAVDMGKAEELVQPAVLKITIE